MRIGLGHVCYAFEPGRVLMLGGLKTTGAWGLRGPADGDVLLHAIIDALLGAAALGDCGDLFLEEPAAKDVVPSAVHVAAALARLAEVGLEPANLDATVVVERLDLRPQRRVLRERLASLLQMTPEQVSVKATTPGGLGALGRAEGITALAVVSLREISA